jgi:two-component system chemotaxis response regulator CheY
MKMGKTILIADDSASMRQLVSFALRDAGYEVVEANDGSDALTKSEASSVDMVVTDLNMPGLDGIELIRRLRKLSQYRFTPIIMLTTESQDSKKQEGKTAGASGWIVKPFTPEQLIGVIKKFIG